MVKKSYTEDFTREALLILLKPGDDFITAIVHIAF